MVSNKGPSSGDDSGTLNSPTLQKTPTAPRHSTLLTRVDLPDFGISGLKARLDAALERSRLAVEPWEDIDYEGAPGLRFKIFPIPEEPIFVVAEAPLVQPGSNEQGPLIRSPMTLDGATHEVEFELCLRRPESLCLELGRDVLQTDFDDSDFDDTDLDDTDLDDTDLDDTEAEDGIEVQDSDAALSTAPGPSADSNIVDSHLTVIGWREYVHLPDWGFEFVRAKADTGARSSAVDVSHVEELPGDRVRFEVVARRGEREKRRMVEADILRRARVKSSFGRSHDRIFVEARITIAGRTIDTEVGLVNRENMLSRMLLGRRSLEGAFLVDSGRRFLHGRRRKSAKVAATKTAESADIAKDRGFRS